MDFSTAMNFIHESRLEVLEMLAEKRLQVLTTLNYLATSTPSTILEDVQDISLLIAEYCQLEHNLSIFLSNMDDLEQQLIS